MSPELSKPLIPSERLKMQSDPKSDEKSEKNNVSSEDSEMPLSGHCLVLLVFAGIAIMFMVTIGRVCKYFSEGPSASDITPFEWYKARSYPSIVWYASSKKQQYSRHVHCDVAQQNIRCDVFDKKHMCSLADAYLFESHHIKAFPLLRKPKTIWGILQHKSPANESIMTYEPYLELFNFSSTFSRNSDVPTPLFWVSSVKHIDSTRYFVNTTVKNSLLTDIAPVIFMASNCDAISEKLAYIMELMEKIKIDSYGVCLHNKDLPTAVNHPDVNAHLYDDAMLSFIARYKFIIAIEDAICNDYMTEKLWRSLEVGTVPIYYGSPLIRDWLPNNKSAILLEDFPTPELLSRHLHYLLRNDTAYEEYLEHKTLQKISNKNLIEELTVRPYQNNLYQVKHQFECFICEKLYNLKSDSFNRVTKKHYECNVNRTSTSLPLKTTVGDQFYRVMDVARNKVKKMFKMLNSMNNSSVNSSKNGISQNSACALPMVVCFSASIFLSGCRF